MSSCGFCLWGSDLRVISARLIVLLSRPLTTLRRNLGGDRLCGAVCGAFCALHSHRLRAEHHCPTDFPGIAISTARGSSCPVVGPTFCVLTAFPAETRYSGCQVQWDHLRQNAMALRPLERFFLVGHGCRSHCRLSHGLVVHHGVDDLSTASVIESIVATYACK